MINIPHNPNALLRRKQAAEALTAAGFPTSAATLATKASRGGGPTYRLFGRCRFTAGPMRSHGRRAG
jgi:hypothetical protein